jgi:sphingosine kinase
MVLATLNVIKGQPLPVDLCSVLLMPSGERRVGFLSTALGLMVDLDIGTEHLRWMGDSRFLVGFLRGVAQNKPCKARLTLDVISDDKEEMARVARQAAAQEAGVKVVGGGTDPLAIIRGVQTAPVATLSNGRVANGDDAKDVNGNGNGAVSNGDVKMNGDKPFDDDLDGDGPLPPARPLQPTSDWLTIESNPTSKKSPSADSSGQSSLSDGPATTTKDGNWEHGQSMLYMYAGLMPWVSRDLNQWPVIRSGSGAIDVVVQRIVPRRVLLNAITSAEHGDAFWEDCQHYYKVRAFIAENLDKAAQPMFTIDGEAFPWDSFHVEVLPRAASFLSLDGRFFHSRFVSTSGGEQETRHKQSKKAHRKNNRRQSTHHH